LDAVLLAPARLVTAIGSSCRAALTKSARPSSTTVFTALDISWEPFEAITDVFSGVDKHLTRPRLQKVQRGKLSAGFRLLTERVRESQEK